MLKKHVNKIIIIACAILLSAAISIQVPLLLVSLYITYKLLSPHLNTKLFQSTVSRILATLIVYVSLLQCLFLVIWLIAKETSLLSMPFIGLVLLLIVWLLVRFSKKNVIASEPVRFILKRDVASILIALLMVTIVTVPSLVATGIDKKSSIISMANGNVDDAAHVGLLNDKIDSDRAITYHTSANDNLRSYGQYPPGWHSLNAMIVKSFSPAFQSGTDSLYAYAITKVFWFFILVLTFSQVTFILSSLFIQSGSRRIFNAWLCIGLLFFSLILFTDAFKEGFYSFLPQLITALFSLVILAQMSLRKKDDEKGWGDDLLLLSIICLGGSLSWLLVLPAFGLIILLVVAAKIIHDGVKSGIVLTLRTLLRHIVVFGFLATSLLVQVYLISRDSSSGSSVTFLQGIMLNGGISQYPVLLYSLLAGGLLLLISFGSRRLSRQLGYVLIGLSALFAFTVCIYLLQIYAIDKNAYYYFKTLNIATTMTAPLAIIGAGMLITYIRNRRGKVPALALLIFIPTFLVLFVGINISANSPTVSRMSYLKGTRMITPTVNESIYKELQSSQYNDKKLVFFYTPGHLDQNDIPTLLLKTNKPASRCFDDVRLSIILETNFSDYLDAVKISCNDYKITFITSPNYLQDYKKQVLDKDLGSIVNVITYRDTFK